MNDEHDSPHARRRRSSQRTPLQQALALLVRREHSQRELARKLKARGIDDDAASAAILRLVEDGWQDDRRFAESLVRTRVAAGYGPLHIRAELAVHGLDAQVAQAVLASVEGSWNEHADALVRRRFGEQDRSDLAWRRKAADLLARRGFDSDSIRAATRVDRED